MWASRRWQGAPWNGCVAHVGCSLPIHQATIALARKVAVLGDAVGGHESICFVPKYLADLVRRPDEELALFAFAVGILRAVEPSGRVGHLADHIVQDLFGDGPKELVARDLPGVDAPRPRASWELA